MLRTKTKFILTSCVILLFAIGSVAQAAPPMQAPSDGDSTTTVGDSLNLDEHGNNLGTIMSGRTDDGDDDTGDDANGDPDDDGDDGSDGDADDGAKHPVASAIADYFEVEYEEVKGLHDSGYGFGNIAKAYFFSRTFPDNFGSPEDILSEAGGMGWGNVLKENGIHPGAVGGKKDKWPKNASSPDEGSQSEDVGASNHVPNGNNGKGVTDLTGPGAGHSNNGNGRGNNQGNGNGGGGNGHGGGKGHSKNK